MFWAVICKIGIILIGLLIVLGGIAILEKPRSVYRNQPGQRNPMEGRRVVFVENESEVLNADGVRGHLEAVGTSVKMRGIYGGCVKRLLG